MSIMSFIKRIVSSFTKKDVRNKLQQITSTLTEQVRPALDVFRETFVESAYKSFWAKAWYQNVSGYFSQQRSHTLKLLDNAVKNAVQLTEQLGEFTRTQLPESIQLEGLTYKRATVLRVIEILDFFADYSIRHLAAIAAAETNLSVFEKPDGQPYPKKEMEWLKSNQNDYIRAIELLNKDVKSLMAALGDVPDVYVDAEGTQAIPALEASSFDPLRIGSFRIVSWSFHFIGIRMADWDIARYERAQKDRQVIQLRLEALRATQRGAADTRAQAMIEGYERELVLVREKIARLEERAQ